MRCEIHVPTRPVLSHSADAVLADGLVFVAGILPVDENGVLVGGDGVVAQARHVFDELGAILGAAGCTFADVVKVTVFLTDVADRPLVNPVRQEVFGDTRPASTLVEVTGLAVHGARIEVDAVAVAP
jgi:2-iminobutanoate/2-iminopropanoate deaminase